ncbi:hypothetical protein OC844_003337 [Tilletia horrida]|nr:hypothetical protein OC844_003337 [Tilletia horrida]
MQDLDLDVGDDDDADDDAMMMDDQQRSSNSSSNSGNSNADAGAMMMMMDMLDEEQQQQQRQQQQQDINTTSNTSTSLHTADDPQAQAQAPAAAQAQGQTPRKPPRKPRPNEIGLICKACGTAESILWRYKLDPQNGPLCNGCGLKYHRKLKIAAAAAAAATAAAAAAAADGGGNDSDHKTGDGGGGDGPDASTSRAGSSIDPYNAQDAQQYGLEVQYPPSFSAMISGRPAAPSRAGPSATSRKRKRGSAAMSAAAAAAATDASHQSALDAASVLAAAVAEAAFGQIMPHDGHSSDLTADLQHYTTTLDESGQPTATSAPEAEDMPDSGNTHEDIAATDADASTSSKLNTVPPSASGTHIPTVTGIPRRRGPGNMTIPKRVMTGYICRDCGVTESSLWRYKNHPTVGPLCNGCGLKLFRKLNTNQLEAGTSAAAPAAVSAAATAAGAAEGASAGEGQTDTVATPAEPPAPPKIKGKKRHKVAHLLSGVTMPEHPHPNGVGALSADVVPHSGGEPSGSTLLQSDQAYQQQQPPPGVQQSDIDADGNNVSQLETGAQRVDAADAYGQAAEQEVGSSMIHQMESADAATQEVPSSELDPAQAMLQPPPLPDTSSTMGGDGPNPALAQDVSQSQAFSQALSQEQHQEPLAAAMPTPAATFIPTSAPDPSVEAMQQQHQQPQQSHYAAHAHQPQEQDQEQGQGQGQEQLSQSQPLDASHPDTGTGTGTGTPTPQQQPQQQQEQQQQQSQEGAHALVLDAAATADSVSLALAAWHRQAAHDAAEAVAAAASAAAAAASVANPAASSSAATDGPGPEEGVAG